jgi:hypothetical protein
MYNIGAVTFVDKIPTMPIVMFKILAVVYYLNAIIITSDPECVTNSTDNNKNKNPAPKYIFDVYSHI